MSLTKQEALDLFRSDDLIGLGMEADAQRRKLHPEGVVTYIIDRNINYTNFCTEYCTFCAFYRPLKGPKAKEGYILDFNTIYDKIEETASRLASELAKRSRRSRDLRSGVRTRGNAAAGISHLTGAVLRI